MDLYLYVVKLKIEELYNVLLCENLYYIEN